MRNCYSTSPCRALVVLSFVIAQVDEHKKEIQQYVLWCCVSDLFIQDTLSEWMKELSECRLNYLKPTMVKNRLNIGIARFSGSVEQAGYINRAFPCIERIH